MLTIAKDSGFELSGRFSFCCLHKSCKVIAALQIYLGNAVSCAANRHVSVFIDNSGWHIENSRLLQCFEKKVQILFSEQQPRLK